MYEVDKLFKEMHEEFEKITEKYEEKMRKLFKNAKLDGFEEGMTSTVKPPSDAQFRKDHKTVQWYGEDYAGVVYTRSKKTAAKLLEVDEDSVEKIGVSWRAYEYEGELMVGYYIGKGEPKWYAWGVYL